MTYLLLFHVLTTDFTTLRVLVLGESNSEVIEKWNKNILEWLQFTWQHLTLFRELKEFLRANFVNIWLTARDKVRW